MAAAIIGSGGWTRLRDLGRGASGAAVFLAADDHSGELFVVKSGGGAAQLRREWGVMSGLSSPHVLKCLGFRAGGRRGGGGSGGDHQLLLEFAPGGSLADVVTRNGDGRLKERAAAAYAGDVLRALDYLHGRSVVHGDVKGSNVVVGADGRAKLADFGCARAMGDWRQGFGGTPAFMAPEVARGEEQGSAADVWALGCTVVEMATGRAPWSDEDDNLLAAVRRIGFTDDAVPAVPPWLSPEGKDFLHRCFQRRAGDRSTAAQLLEHPFIAATSYGVNNEPAATSVKTTWVSPTSALDAALWEESETDDEADDLWNSPVCRIRAMACHCSAWPPAAHWDTGNGWIDVLAPAAADEVCDCPESSLPDWDSDDEGWTVVCSSPSSAGETGGTARSEEFGEVAAAGAELFSEAVRSVGAAGNRGVVLVHQENVISSSNQQPVLGVLVTAEAAIKQSSILSYYILFFF